MADLDKKKKPPTVSAGGEEFPEKPGVFDYVKESFEPTSTRVNLDAIRKRRQQVGS